MENKISSDAVDSNVGTKSEFSTGTTVIYGLIGKCQIIAIEARQIAGRQIQFYKLEKQRSPLSRSSRQEPAIWLPVHSATDRGLRAAMTEEQAHSVFSILQNREYYFSIREAWSAVHTKLEDVIRKEGAIGLAKAASYLHVLKKRQIVPSQEVARFYENVFKALIKELSDVLDRPVRAIELEIERRLRQKLLPDN